MGVVPKSYDAGKLEVYENVYLVCSEDEEGAIEYGRKIGAKEESDNDDLEIEGVSAQYSFLGVRKVVRISNLDGPQDSAPPSVGAELTYSLLQFENLNEAIRFAAGLSVVVNAME
jgi:hypothetical protein